MDQETTTLSSQKPLFLPSGIYKCSIVIKDTISGKIGSLQTGIRVPTFKEGSLTLSTIILSPSFGVLERTPERLESFIIGDLKLIPSVDGKFAPTDKLVVYCKR